MNQTAPRFYETWIIAGTVPDPAFPLLSAPCAIVNGRLQAGQRTLAVCRGTTALLAAVCLALEHLKNTSLAGMRNIRPWAVIAGDTGKGSGSFQVYAKLLEELPRLMPAGITYHYLLPDIDWHGRILSVQESLPRPLFSVADAGYMYAAKMSGFAASYDLFTPDIGELAFLADQNAPHPFYTRNFLLADENKAEDLIASAYATGGAAKNMLVKGKKDRLVMNGRTVFCLEEPTVEALEAIGGTGDSLTGLITALLAAGMPLKNAGPAAMMVNRKMGALADPSPESGIDDILNYLGRALEETPYTMSAL